MTEMTIDTGIVIDDVESVIKSIELLCDRKISDFNVVQRFINKEKNTKFYLDKALNSFMQPGKECRYVWLDTGFVDRNGNPILISLLRDWDVFVGHVVGTINTLSENVCRYFRLSKIKAVKKIDLFRKKYAEKSSQRNNQHIMNESEYLLTICNEDCVNDNTLASKLKDINFDFCEQLVEENMCESSEEKFQIPDFSIREESITIGLLLEKMDSMQHYMDELVRMLDQVGDENNAKICDLQKRNDEYKRAIVQIRTFNQEQNITLTSVKSDGMPGHAMLGGRKKILVVGSQDIGVNVVYGITKQYGFQKNDFEFLDYEKAKKNLDRIRKDGKYAAIIFGACPHKTSGSFGYSSAIEKLKQTEGMPFITDARCKSGKLKVTKESFKRALEEICNNMRLSEAS